MPEQSFDLDHVREAVTQHPSAFDGVHRALLAEVDRLSALNAKFANRIATMTESIGNEVSTEIIRQKAEAWDEGLSAGCDRWCDSREFGDKPVNPYGSANA